MAKTPDLMNLCSKNLLWLAAPFQGCWGQREVICRVGPPAQNCCCQAKAGSHRSWQQDLPWPPYTSAASQSHSTPWGQPEESPVGHSSLVATSYGITGFSAEHSKQYQPAYFSLHLDDFFLYGKRLYCDKRNLPPRKHIIFLSCTPLLPDLPPIFSQDFFPCFCLISTIWQHGCCYDRCLP